MLLSCSVTQSNLMLLSRHGNFAALLQYCIACKLRQQDTKSLFQIVKHTGQNFQQCLHDSKHPLPTRIQPVRHKHFGKFHLMVNASDIRAIPPDIFPNLKKTQCYFSLVFTCLVAISLYKDQFKLTKEQTI